MRNIKFRAWNGGYFEFGEFNFKTGCLGCNFSSYVEIDSPQQFTGIKDKNEVEIYKGDIVKVCVNNHYWMCIVDHCVGGGSNLYAMEYCNNVSIEDDEYTYKRQPSCSRMTINPGMEVIGNIHENPELL